MQKIREEKDETPTIYSRACGFVETVDDYIGLGCLDRRKKEMRAGSGCLSQVPHTIGIHWSYGSTTYLFLSVCQRPM